METLNRVVCLKEESIVFIKEIRLTQRGKILINFVNNLLKDINLIIVINVGKEKKH
jgi:hypothetical protein